MAAGSLQGTVFLREIAETSHPISTSNFRSLILKTIIYPVSFKFLIFLAMNEASFDTIHRHRHAFL